MQTYLNGTGVPLSVAVYLATDHYDIIPDTISATGLLKPVRQAILAPRVPNEQARSDVTSLVKSRMGSSIHDGVEKAWVGGHYKESMKKLGYPQKIIDKVMVNPEGVPAEGTIPVYMEQRMFREFMGKTISGKFDFIAEGRLEDFKSTGTFTWTNGTKVEDYQLQGSIYRWIDHAQPVPKIYQEHMAIQFFFWDWMEFKTKSEKGYPARQVEQQLIPLLPLDETEDFVAGKIKQFEMYRNAEECNLPDCTDKELWRKKTVWKYYKDPSARAQGKRSTKNFENSKDAYELLTKQGNTGIVVEVPGEVVACKYCPAFPICTQKDRFIADGSLKLA